MSTEFSFQKCPEALIFRGLVPISHAPF